MTCVRIRWFVAAFLAALMSSIDSYLNSAATIVSNDFYKRFVRKDPKEKELVLFGRITVLVLMLLSAGLALGMVSSEEIDEESIEKLKEGDILESTFTEFAEQSPELFEALIAERDRYMAARLRQGASMAAPSYAGHRGHPVGFSSDWREELCGLSGDAGARRLIEAHPQALELIETADPGIFRDIDYRHDLP